MNDEPLPLRDGIDAELEKILPDHLEAIDQTQKGNGETMRLVLDIPVEFAAMATWLDYQFQAKAHDLKPSIDVGFPPVHGHKKRAKRHLYSVLWNWYQEELHFLFHRMHHVLQVKDEATERADALSSAIASGKVKMLRSDTDDDIPF